MRLRSTTSFASRSVSSPRTGERSTQYGMSAGVRTRVSHEHDKACDRCAARSGRWRRRCVARSGTFSTRSSAPSRPTTRTPSSFSTRSGRSVPVLSYPLSSLPPVPLNPRAVTCTRSCYDINCVLCGRCALGNYSSITPNTFTYCSHALIVYDYCVHYILIHILYLFRLLTCP